MMKDERLRKKAETLIRDVDPKRSFPEDSHMENGGYMCQCCICDHMFIGHKRRVVCKVCT